LWTNLRARPYEHSPVDAIFQALPVQIRILGSIALAMVLGAVIGMEREAKDKPAGLRTHMLVAGAATFLVALSDVAVKRFNVDLGTGLVRSDPIRIIEAVITGISFLGAGTILRHKGSDHVEGLTTAASLLFVAALGVCVALSQVLLAIGVTALVFATLRGLGLLRWRLARRSEQNKGPDNGL
jgi:putative Mg2+ transporter-C (MgtC) family protein